jgi:hypothetical protein
MFTAPHYVESDGAALEREKTILNPPPVKHHKEQSHPYEGGRLGKPRKVSLSPINIISDNHQDKQRQGKTREARVMH